MFIETSKCANSGVTLWKVVALDCTVNIKAFTNLHNSFSLFLCIWIVSLSSDYHIRIYSQATTNRPDCGLNTMGKLPLYSKSVLKLMTFG